MQPLMHRKEYAMIEFSRSIELEAVESLLTAFTKTPTTMEESLKNADFCTPDMNCKIKVNLKKTILL